MKPKYFNFVITNNTKVRISFLYTSRKGKVAALAYCAIGKDTFPLPYFSTVVCKVLVNITKRYQYISFQWKLNLASCYLQLDHQLLLITVWCNSSVNCSYWMNSWLGVRNLHIRPSGERVYKHTSYITFYQHFFLINSTDMLLLYLLSGNRSLDVDTKRNFLQYWLLNRS